MTESRARLVDAACKIVATLGLVVGGGWTLYTYFNARAGEAKTASIEARKPFLAKRLEIYSESVQLASRIAMGSADVNIPGTQEEKAAYGKQIDKDILRFKELEIGSMSLVEDNAVHDAMADFGSCLSATNHCIALYSRAKKLAHACRDSVGREWQVDVSDSAITKEDLEKARH